MDDAEINLTPLIDVVFVLLIMFIVVVPLLELDGVQLAAGEGSVRTVKATSPIQIHARADNSVLVERNVVDGPQLARWLQQMRNDYPGEKPQLFCDRRAEFGTYQTIKNAAERAGFEEMDVILEPA